MAHDRDLERQDALFPRHWRATESVLVEGEAVVVVGVARRELSDASAGSYRESPRRLVISAAGSVPLYVSNEPRRLC